MGSRRRGSPFREAAGSPLPCGTSGSTSRLARARAVALGVVLGVAGGSPAGATACRPPPAEADLLTDSAYVEMMARLGFLRREAERRGAPPEARDDDARRAVLEEHGVTEDQLRRYAAERGRDPEHMQQIWERIAKKVDRLSRATSPGEPEPDVRPGETEAEEEGGAGGGREPREEGEAGAGPATRRT